MRKYALPDSLAVIISQSDYEQWLHHRAVAHVKRDRRKRGNSTATNEIYKRATHRAVIAAGEFDAYTGERLDWKLIRKWNNEDSKKGGREYKRRFALLPSVDHVGDGSGPADFKICAWRTNDAKHDMTYDELLGFCEKVLDAAKKRLIMLK